MIPARGGRTARPALARAVAGWAALLLCLTLVVSDASASTALDLPGCRDNTLERNDDGSSGPVPLPFPVDFYGDRYDSVYVNNNGNVTFDAPLATYVPFDLTRTDRVIVAPLFADVDTRPSDGGSVTYGTTTYAGRPAFCALWDEVGYYRTGTDRRNTFQLLLVDRTGGSGDFEIVFRYATVQWELGSASGGVPARAGFSNGLPETSVQLTGSAQSGAFLDGGPHALVQGSLNSGEPGTWRFRVLQGTAGNDPRNVPPGVDRSTSWWDWPDGDDDGLPDHWESAGVWVGDRRVDLAARGARPGQRDAFVYVDVVEGERWNATIEEMLRSSFRASPLDIRLHVIHGPRPLRRSEVPARVVAGGSEGDAFFAEMVRRGFADSGLGGSPGSVPALAKYVCVCPDYTGDDTVGGEASGIKADHLIVTVYEAKWIGAIEAQTGVRFANEGLVGDRLNAITAMHELGHLYGLKHHGSEDAPKDDRSYRSIMSYAYNAFGVPRPAEEAIATGDLLPRIDFSRSPTVNLDWRWGGGFGALSLVHGQHGERGDFYTNVGETAPSAEEAPDEPSIQELLGIPEVRDSIAAGARAFEAATRDTSPPVRPAPPAPPPSAAQPPTTQRDRTKPAIRIRGISFGKVRGSGRRAKARVTVRFVASDNATPSRRLRLRCRVDRGRFTACKAGRVVRTVRVGRHRFTVEVTDGAGNRGTLTRTFVLKRAKR